MISDTTKRKGLKEVMVDYMSTVKDFVVENFLFGDGTKLNEETSFLESGIIDSTGILELIAFLEETYGIAVGDDELVPENFNTLNNISEYLDKKLNSHYS